MKSYEIEIPSLEIDLLEKEHREIPVFSVSRIIKRTMVMFLLLIAFSSTLHSPTTEVNEELNTTHTLKQSVYGVK
jgi:hypothetical protein